MSSSTLNNELLLLDDSSGSSSNVSVLRNISPSLRHEVETALSLLSLDSDEEDDVQFDSKQLSSCIKITMYVRDNLSCADYRLNVTI